MEGWHIKQLALIYAEYARVLGMEAENKVREALGQSMAYSQQDFENQAANLEFLARQM